MQFRGTDKPREIGGHSKSRISATNGEREGVGDRYGITSSCVLCGERDTRLRY
jgi:hypothetical protein